MPAATVTANSENAPKVSMKTFIAFFCMVFGMFMAILDIQIVSASLAEIQAGISASSDEISWVQTAYLIAEVIMIPLSGFLNRLLSTRVLFTIAAAGFTISSLLCACATSIDQMLIYRAIQGFIGGSMIPSVFSVAFTLFSVKQRNIVSPLIGLVATLAPTIGPTIGGYLSQSFSWHWLFLINVPTGFLVALFSWLLIDFDEGDLSLWDKFDWTGFIGLTLSLGSLEYILEEGAKNAWFQDNTICTMTFLMVVGTILFFYRAFTAAEPIVDLWAFRNLNFALGSSFSFILGIGLFGLTFLYPAYLSQIRQYNAMQIGETMFVSGLSMLLAAPLVAFLSAKMDLRLLIGLGFAGFAAGTWMASGITSDWDFNELFWPQVLRGFSMMASMVPINNIALGTLPPERMKGASGVFNLTRNLGGAVGLALLSTMLIKRNAFHYERLAEMVQPANYEAQKTLTALQHSFHQPGIDAASAALAQMSNMVKAQAAVLSFSDCFLLITGFFIALCFALVFVKKPENEQSADAH